MIPNVKHKRWRTVTEDQRYQLLSGVANYNHLNAGIRLQSLCVSQVSAAGIACWLERRTRDRKVASSNPGRSGGRIFFSRVNFGVLILIRCPFQPRVTAVARKRPRSIYKKCRWQVTPKLAYTLDPSKSEWADYAAAQAECGNPSGNELTRNSSRNTHSVTVVSAH